MNVTTVSTIAVIMQHVLTQTVILLASVFRGILVMVQHAPSHVPIMTVTLMPLAQILSLDMIATVNPDTTVTDLPVMVRQIKYWNMYNRVS